jgi:hypothetical protein
MGAMRETIPGVLSKVGLVVQLSSRFFPRIIGYYRLLSPIIAYYRLARKKKLSWAENSPHKPS